MRELLSDLKTLSEATPPKKATGVQKSRLRDIRLQMKNAAKSKTDREMLSALMDATMALSDYLRVEGHREAAKKLRDVYMSDINVPALPGD